MTEWKPGEKTVLVLGSEAHGLADEIRETVGPVGTFVRIDGAHCGTARGDPHRNVGVESLNVAVAGGIIMHRMQI